MKITEIITEGAGYLRKSTQRSTPGMETWPDLDNGNVPYLQYRMGLAMAGSPDITIDSHGPVGGQLTTIAYTKADQDIIDGAAKIMGVKSHKRSSKKSCEVDSTNTTSPIQARKPVQKPKTKK